MSTINNLIYFNNNRSTALDAEVEAVMKLQDQSTSGDDITVHEIARKRVARLLNCDAAEIIFTPGTTPALQLAIKNLAFFSGKKEIITSVIEHAVVINACKELEAQGYKVTWLKVNREGLIDLKELEKNISTETAFVCIMAANNETGVIQPVEQIAEICKKKNVRFFSDASQYAGKIRCDVPEIGFDALVFGAHKMHGPPGIGVLYAKKELIEKYFPEGDAKGLSNAQIAGMGKCAEVAARDHWENNTHISRLKNHFEHQLLEIKGLRINGSTRTRLYNTSNLTFPGHMKVGHLSNSFDFTNFKTHSSHVLGAMGINEDQIQNSYRFSFGKYNTMEEIQRMIDEIFLLEKANAH